MLIATNSTQLFNIANLLHGSVAAKKLIFDNTDRFDNICRPSGLRDRSSMLLQRSGSDDAHQQRSAGSVCCVRQANNWRTSELQQRPA